MAAPVEAKAGTGGRTVAVMGGWDMAAALTGACNEQIRCLHGSAGNSVKRACLRQRGVGHCIEHGSLLAHLGTGT